MYYDAESVTRLSKSVVRVLVKSVYTENGASEIVLSAGEEYKNVTSSVDLMEINCSNRKYRILSTAYYSMGCILNRESKVSEWRSIAPKSAMGKLFKKVCK